MEGFVRKEFVTYTYDCSAITHHVINCAVPLQWHLYFWYSGASCL